MTLDTKWQILLQWPFSILYESNPKSFYKILKTDFSSTVGNETNDDYSSTTIYSPYCKRCNDLKHRQFFNGTASSHDVQKLLSGDDSKHAKNRFLSGIRIRLR